MTTTTTPEERIIAAVGMVIADGDLLYYDHSTPAGAIFYRARQAGAGWRLADAETALDELYRSVGDTNKGTGYAWHIGRHPLQEAMAATDNAS